MGYLVYVGGGVGGPGVPVSPVNVVYQPPPWVHMTTPPPPSQAEKGPEEWSLPEKVILGNTHTHTHKPGDFQIIMKRLTATVFKCEQ